MLGVDPGAFLVVVLTAGVAAAIVGALGKRAILPVVVVELLLGVLIGPSVLGIVNPDEFIVFFSSLGLGMLFFFAGYEVDFSRIRGRPLRLAGSGWLISLAIAYALAGLLVAGDFVVSVVFVGSAIATTAIGTLLPILTDAGEVKTRFGTFLLAAGAVGEFGPILLITFLFSTNNAISSFLLMMLFIVLAVLAALFAIRSVGSGWRIFARAMETSSQLPIRTTVVLVFALAFLAESLGLDLLLGGFVAGVITRLALRGQEVRVLESKLSAVGYGFLIPFFFVVSGINFDLEALLESPRHLLSIPVFLAAFLIVRGVPAALLYRKVLVARDRLALAFFSATELPLVVAITTIALDEDRMRSTTAAALVGAAVLSTAIFPVVGLRLRRGAADEEPQPSAI